MHDSFKGNATTDLWATMGQQVDGLGVQREGQACYLLVHPKAHRFNRPEYSAVLVNEGDSQNGPIDLVAQYVLENYVQMRNYDATSITEKDVTIHEYDGLRAGAGWIYAALIVAKSHGCTQAIVSIASNDGNLYMDAWDTEIGAYVEAVHNTYYGT
jgi:hypothetical protein